MVFTSEEMEKNFWSKVDRKEDFDACWEWKGAKDKKTGYGVFRISSGKNGTDVAHRVIMIHVYGQPPAEKPVVRHLCNNKRCVNPRHLAFGSYRDNWEDSVKAGTAKPFKMGYDERRYHKRSEEEKREVGQKVRISWRKRKAAAHPEVMNYKDKEADEVIDTIIIDV